MDAFVRTVSYNVTQSNSCLLSRFNQDLVVGPGATLNAVFNYSHRRLSLRECALQLINYWNFAEGLLHGSSHIMSHVWSSY